MSADPILSVNLRAGYRQQTILHDVRFVLRAGETLGFAGTSGAGKSTLVLALLGLLRWRGGWAEGEVLLGGENLLTLPEREARRLRGRRIALVPQSPLSALNPAVSLRTHFSEAWRAHETSGRQALGARLAELLTQVQLPLDAAFLKRKPGEVSVGQAQRVMLALALLHRPAVLLADEPTSALDPVTQAGVLELLRTLTRETAAALVYVSHDLLSILQLCDNLAVLAEGRIAEQVPVRSLGEGVHTPALTALLNTLPAPPAVLRSYGLSGFSGLAGSPGFARSDTNEPDERV